MSSVHLFFLIGRKSLNVEQACLFSDSNPTVNSHKYLPVRYLSWEGRTHQEAWDKAQEWLRSDTSVLPEALREMVVRKK